LIIGFFNVYKFYAAVDVAGNFNAEIYGAMSASDDFLLVNAVQTGQ
jgi:hypothetical protein